ncbi:MAG: 30S ribosomal protein S19 [Pseudomonadota bacterium]
MSRSVWKGPYIDFKLLKKVLKVKKEGSHKPIQTWSRSCTIVPQFVGVTIAVHNGKQHIPVAIKESMVGRKLGEYSPTKKFAQHAADKKGKKG